MAKSKDLLGKIESRWALAKEFGAIPVIGAAVSGFAAYATSFMQNYAPFSWVIGAMIGALIVQGWALLRGWQLQRLAQAERIKLMEPPRGYVSLASDRFENQRIYLPDILIPGQRVLRGKELVNSEIIGPVNIYIMRSPGAHTELRGCTFYDTDLVVVKDDAELLNVVGIEDCRIVNCRLYKVTLFCTAEEKAFIEKGLGQARFVN